MWLSALIITQTSDACVRADHFSLLSLPKITPAVSLLQATLLDDQAFKLVNQSKRLGSEKPDN